MNKCCECDDEAIYIRYTQFSGVHPFCEKHAKMEKDFGKMTNYMFWEKVSDTYRSITSA